MKRKGTRVLQRNCIEKKKRMLITCTFVETSILSFDIFILPITKRPYQYKTKLILND